MYNVYQECYLYHKLDFEVDPSGSRAYSLVSIIDLDKLYNFRCTRLYKIFSFKMDII